jgi:phenylacetate-CoA ligase
MTEVGPATYECPAEPGVLHVIESAYLAEVVHPATGQAVAPGQPGELVLTTLDRIGSPVLRYRTGDLLKARPYGQCACGRHELALTGGILGRCDDMVVVRGVNVFPSAIEEIVRGCGGVAEFRAHLETRGSLSELSLEVEPSADCPDVGGLARRLQQSLQTALSLRVPVRLVPSGALPRFEMKAKRWIKTD